MNSVTSLNTDDALKNAKRLLILLLAVGFFALSGCGSTKVYTADKTITYKGDLYNVSNVQKISTRVEGKLPGGEVKNMKNMDKKAVGSLLQEGSPIVVTTIVDMDSQEMIYQRSSVTKYSEFSSMMKNINNASGKIGKFMADKKSTQLKLK
jgi:hypothetical protein